jgi:hypothetical protein
VLVLVERVGTMEEISDVSAKMELIQLHVIHQWPHQVVKVNNITYSNFYLFLLNYRPVVG